MFTDKVIAVTGDSEIIGKALTKEFLRRGAKGSTCTKFLFQNQKGNLVK